eukprot:TRINITY_DN33430_c0_g1_i1.p1 TRINITY_DN33430_c0_g1~~TRINITY_DN33430_c0_g1_i1.p1  ORF type:complete len:345 (+),score=81.63 TRINITY_DN33430_c0_g1_i1:49-1083(+)
MAARRHMGGPMGSFAVRNVVDARKDVMVVRFSPDSQLVGAGCADGVVRCFDAHTGTASYTFDTMATSVDKLPATCMRFRPTREDRARNVAIVGTGAGDVHHIHLSSKRSIHCIHTDDNEIFAVDYRPDGDVFAAAGKDHTVRVYDEETRGQIQSLQWAAPGSPEPRGAHSKRVQSVRFAPSDPHLLVSAGWDRTVQIWDTRQDQATGYLYGPYVCGDAVDVHMDNRTLVSGSARDEDQLQVWDLRSPADPCTTLPLPGDEGEKAPHVFGVHFRPGAMAAVVAVGTTVGTYICDVGARGFTAGRCVPEDFRAVFSVAWSPDGTVVASAGRGGQVALATAVSDVHG